MYWTNFQFQISPSNSLDYDSDENMDSDCLDQKWRTIFNKRLDENMDSDCLDQKWRTILNKRLMKKYKSNLPKENRHYYSQQIIKEISKVVKPIDSKCKVMLYGSFDNGFATKESDIDVTVIFPRNCISQAQTDNLKLIYIYLKSSEVFFNVKGIFKAKVPIIKFNYKRNIHGDISINNLIAIQNTALLKLYHDLDPCVSIIGILIKWMVKINRIGEVYGGTLSSFAYIVMLIHFLQKRKILPVIQEIYKDFQPMSIVDDRDSWHRSNLKIIKKLWQPRFSSEKLLPDLWIGFYEYYTQKFDIENDIINISQSAPLRKRYSERCFAIQEPFNNHRDIASHLKADKFQLILSCFREVIMFNGDPYHIERP